MKLSIQWNQNMEFISSNDKGKVVMDAKSPIGKGNGFSPKELVVMGLAGCTAMDVIALMKKHKQDVSSFDVGMDVLTTPGQPSVFSHATIHFIMRGNVDRTKLIEAVELSQTQYCGVSAMLVKAFPIEYRITLNNEDIATGKARFA